MNAFCFQFLSTFLDIEQRNGIGMAAPGDKSYQVVEYSPDFHKYGSTLPVVNFGFVYFLHQYFLCSLSEAQVCI